MLIIQIASGILLAFLIIEFFPLVLGVISVILMIFVLIFINDKITGPSMKRRADEAWKKFDEQREIEKMQKCKEGTVSKKANNIL